MVKAILFDADGVIINHGLMFSEILERDQGITREQTLPFFTGVLNDCVSGKTDLKEVLPPYLKEWGWKKSVDDFILYWNQSEHNINKHLVTYISELRNKGVICCLATNQTKYRFEYMVKEMGFGKFFDKLYVSAHLGYRKPNLEFFKAILKDLSFKKNEILFWDDTQENVKAAKEFGIQAELYSSFEDFKEKMNNYLLLP